MDNILETILKETYSLSLLKHRMRILKSYLTQKLFGSQKAVFSQADLNWLNSKDQTFYQEFTRENVYQLLNELEKQLNQMVPLVIYFPFEANDETLAQIGNFTRTIFAKPNLLLEAKFDPKLIAGCALSFKGIYKDYSLRAKIEQKKGEILESFKKFSR